MNNIVIIPCYRRPEYLQLCLERIIKADLYDQMYYIFCLDNGYDKENFSIIKNFDLDGQIIHREHFKNKMMKQSRNLLYGYKNAYNLGANYIFLIEEDVMIANDFFRWHLDIHKKEKCFCSIASRNNNTFFKTTNDINKYYYGKKTDYQSLGVCFHRDIIKNYMLPHINMEYFNNPFRYFEHIFKNNWLGREYGEQDGLIRRIKSNTNLPVVFPHVPRCHHAGLYGYNRNSRFKVRGNVQQKIIQLKKILANKEIYKSYCLRENFYKDSEPVNLTIKKYNNLILE